VRTSIDALSAAWIGNLIAYTGLLRKLSSLVYGFERGSNLILESNKAFNRTLYHLHQELEFTIPFKDTFEVLRRFIRLYEQMYHLGLPYTLFEVRCDAEAALVVGERGLSLEGRKVRLAGWITYLAEGLGCRGLALEAALAAFHADPSLASYLRVLELAGEAWSEHRQRLLDHLRQSTSYVPTGQVDVFLHENPVGDAISAIEGDPFGGLVAKVADAAIETHPDWVIETCRRRAEEIMNQGRSKDYDEAVDWLAKVRDAYLSGHRA
jgi:uncharacterized Zn finger protein